MSLIKNEIGVMAIAAVVAAIASRYLPPTPGIENIITLLGAVSAIAGVAIAVVFRASGALWLFFAVVFALLLAVGAILGFYSVVSGEPGLTAAYLLYFCTVILFGALGFLLEIAKLQVIQ